MTQPSANNRNHSSPQHPIQRAKIFQLLQRSLSSIFVWNHKLEQQSKDGGNAPYGNYSNIAALSSNKLIFGLWNVRQSIMEVLQGSRKRELIDKQANCVFESCFTSQYNPELYVKQLQLTIESKFSHSIFIQDLVEDLVLQLSDAVTQIDRLNRNVKEDLTKLGLEDHAKWLEQVRKTQAWFIQLTSQKLSYVTKKYKSMKDKEMARPQEKTYCSICSKQLREAKIQQISNSLNTTCYLAEYKNIKQQQEQQQRYNQMDIILSQIQKSKKQLLGLNNQKTTFCLQQFLHETNHTIQVFYQDRTNFQKMQDNRDVIAILFRQFISKFMEVSHNDIKPTVIKCAEDLADFLFRRRKDAIEFQDKEVQTTAPYPTKPSLKTSETKSRSTTKDVKDAARKNLQLLSEHKMKIELLTKQNNSLEKQIKYLHTQKILSSMRMIQDNIIQKQGDQIQNKKKRQSENNQASDMKQNKQNKEQSWEDSEERKQDFQSIKVNDGSNSKRVTIFRASIKPTLKPFQTQFINHNQTSTEPAALVDYIPKPSHRKNTSSGSQTNSNYPVEQPEDVQDSQELSKYQTSRISLKQKSVMIFQTVECEVQVNSETQEMQIQTDQILFQEYRKMIMEAIDREAELRISKFSKQTLNNRLSRDYYQTESVASPRLLLKEMEMTNTTGDWSKLSMTNQKEILQSQELSSYSSSSEMSPEDLKEESIKNQLITMMAKVNLNNLKHMTDIHANILPSNQRNQRVTISNRMSLNDGGASIIGKSLKPLGGSTRPEPVRKSVFNQSVVEKKNEFLESAGGESTSKNKRKSTPQRFQVLSMTQNRFGKMERNSQKVNESVLQGKPNVFNLSTMTHSRPKRQMDVAERIKTQTQTQTNNKMMYSSHSIQRNHTESEPRVSKHHQIFSNNDLIDLFGSIQSAYEYQSSPPIKQKLSSTKFKKKQQNLISNMYDHLQDLKKSDNLLYHRIKGFIKFPYQSVVNQFDGPMIQSSFSLGAFTNLMTFLLNRHEECGKMEGLGYCRHIHGLLQKFKYFKEGQEIEKVFLPKLQEQPQ